MAEEVNELNKLHEEFKSAIKRHDDEATARLNDAISDMEGKMRDLERAANRPELDADNTKDAEQKAAFVDYLRTGDKAKVAELKSMSAGSAGDGGYTVPKVIYNQIQKALVDVSVMRSVARVLTATTPDFHIPFSVGGTKSAWVGETDSRPETNTSTLVEIVPNFGELYATPMVTQTLLEDSQFDIAGYISSEVGTEFARAEGAAFLNGTGTKQPKGLLNVATAATADATRAFGTVQFVPTAGDITADILIAFVHTLKAGYRANARWLMTKATLGVVRGLKDAYGQFLWQPSLQAGAPSLLLGYPVVEMEDMPEIATNAFPIAFGDFNRAYTISDRVGMSMLYNPYINAPYIAYQSRKRVGGAVIDTQAYKLLKITAAS